MMTKINDNKNVFSSIVCEVNEKVFFFNKHYKRLKCKIKTPRSIKNKFYPHMIRLKKMCKDN